MTMQVQVNEVTHESFRDFVSARLARPCFREVVLLFSILYGRDEELGTAPNSSSPSVHSHSMVLGGFELTS